jgi:hypothetical protein
MSRPPEVILAESARLTRKQREFRAAVTLALKFSLPLPVWLNHRYSVRPSEKDKPVQCRGQERWYSYFQVVRRGVNPRTRGRWIRMVSGGTMSNSGGRSVP